MKRKELLNNPAYWTAELQLELYRQIESFMEEKHMNKKQLADFLGCSKGYVSQLLSGNYDHKISKFMELSLAIGKIPEVSFVSIDKYIERESKSFTVKIVENKNNLYRFPVTSSDCFENVA